MTNPYTPTSPQSTPSDNSSTTTEFEKALQRARFKAYWYLLPLLFVSYVIAYVDRQNVALVKLKMVEVLPGFTETVIGTGAGIFFLGYFLLEVPGTLIVERWSARKWICRIMISWGLLAALTAFVRTPIQFYGIRFLLGLAEAGFFPGVIVFLTHWFPRRDRTTALAIFFIASPFAQIISPKITGYLMQMPSIGGLDGWQWVYIIWGLPAIVLGFIVLFYLPDHPRNASWLRDDERDALEKTLEAEKATLANDSHRSIFTAMADPKVLLLGLTFFGMVTATYGIEFFIPSILKDWYEMKDEDLNRLTWLVILPPTLGLIGQLAVGWSSDYFKERRFHAIVPLLCAALALGICPYTKGNMWATIGCFMVAFAGVKGFMPPFWSLPSMFLTASAAAGSIGLINSLGNLGGFCGPYILGWMKDNLGSFNVGLYILSASLVMSAIIVAAIKLPKESG